MKVRWLIAQKVSLVSFCKIGLTVEVEIDNGVLTIKTKSQNTKEENGRDYYFREIKRSGSERKVELPNYLVGDPEAEIKNGLLTLKWKHDRKAEAVSKVKKIEVKKA